MWLVRTSVTLKSWNYGDVQRCNIWLVHYFAHRPVQFRMQFRSPFTEYRVSRKQLPESDLYAVTCINDRPDPEIPDARRGIGVYFPDPGQIGIPESPNPGIPAKSGFPIPRIRDSGRIGIPDSPNPGFRPNRDSRFPESRDPGQIGIQIRENPNYFAATRSSRTVIAHLAHCQRQATASPIRLRRPWVGTEAHRPMTRSRQRLHAPVEAHTT